MQAKGQDSQASDKRQAYLVRCWQEADARWRYSVEAVDGRSLPRRGFSSQNDLLIYLQNILPSQNNKL
ncbi:MAG: hypothetical protein H6662_12000 [Ardenticatenaceae bacterium]|nr:hypothetical protein [Anaerolineales bacterium]MCB8922298.1 hypothetical protein [Ardenticatenaceae bacterium]MCB8990517.1 hypothetical protein [Ardenticatenaceae bacterium]MCB9005677.1 hypothetical protein [Ardenticatenaceae bacterium]